MSHFLNASPEKIVGFGKWQRRSDTLIWLLKSVERRFQSYLTIRWTLLKERTALLDFFYYCCFSIFLSFPPLSPHFTTYLGRLKLLWFSSLPSRNIWTPILEISFNKTGVRLRPFFSPCCMKNFTAALDLPIYLLHRKKNVGSLTSHTPLGSWEARNCLKIQERHRIKGGSNFSVLWLQW